MCSSSWTPIYLITEQIIENKRLNVHSQACNRNSWMHFVDKLSIDRYALEWTNSWVSCLVDQ